MRAKLDRLGHGIREAIPPGLLEALALNFERVNPDAPLGGFGEFLEAKAGEWEELRARLSH